MNALKLVYTDPKVTAELPSAGRVTLLQQPEQHRYVAHLLSAPPLQRGRTLVIEDLPPLERVSVEVRLPERVRRAYLIPGGKPLKMQSQADALRIVGPRFQCHCAVVFEY